MDEIPASPVPTPPRPAPWIWLLPLAVLGGLSYWLLTQPPRDQSPAKTTDSPTPTTVANTAADKSDWKTYFNETANFTFRYPPTARLGFDKGEGLMVSVTVNDLTAMEDGPNGFDRENIGQDQAALASGDPATPFRQGTAYQLESIPAASAKSFLVLQQFEVCDVQFDRVLITYKDNYQAVISWQYQGDKIIENNSSYFTIDSMDCGQRKIWRDTATFATDLAAGRTDAVSQSWYDSFDQMVRSFRWE